MARSMWDSIIGYLVSSIICAIFTIGIFNVGLNEKIAILVACFGWAGGLTVWYANFVSRNKKEEMKELRLEISLHREEFYAALEKKADSNDITHINCNLELIRKDHEENSKRIKEAYDIILKIYKEMYKG